MHDYHQHISEDTQEISYEALPSRGNRRRGKSDLKAVGKFLKIS